MSTKTYLSVAHKVMTILVVTLLLSLTGFNPANAAPSGLTYYVDKTNGSCSDAGTGLTPALPFCTIGRGTSVAVAGDTVQILAGSYAETVTVPKSGSAGLPITYSAMPGAIVTGNGLASSGSAFRISSKSYVIVDGFTITGTAYYGIYVSGSNHISISNNHVSYSGKPVSGSSRVGIYLSGTTDSSITGNTTDHNSDDGIRLANGAVNNMVGNNVSFANARQWSRSATGIHVNGSGSYNNTIIHNITYANEDSGLQFYNKAHNNYVIGNLTYGNGDHGIDISNAPGNTMIGNTAQGNHTAGINLEGSGAPGSSGAKVMNNVSVDNGIAPITGQNSNIRVDASSVPGTTIDYDLVYLSGSGTVQIQWNGTSYATMAAFKAAVPGQEVHGLQANPLFIAPVPPAGRPPALVVGNYHLQAVSPVIDSANADAPSEPTLDLDGNVRVDDPVTTNTGAGVRTYDDRGAYEFQPVSGAPTATPQPATPTPTVTSTRTSTPTNTNTPTPTFTPTNTPANTPTATLTNTPTLAPSLTPTSTFAPINTPLPPTATATPTEISIPTDTNTPIPTFTPTDTPANTPTATLTNTSTPGPSLTPTSTFTPVNTLLPPTATATQLPTATFTVTPTTVPGSPLTFIANADSYVREAGPDSNYGKNTQLWVTSGTNASYEGYLIFTVSGVLGSVQSATLRIYAISSTIDGPAVYATTNDWTETGITWNTRPVRTSSGMDDKGAIATGIWVEYNVTPLVTGDGTYSFALVTSSTDSVSFSSREGSQPPQLVLNIGP